MTNSYYNLIEQTFEFPKDEFDVRKGNLHYYGIELPELIEKHGSPLRLTYLPRIGSQINRARQIFSEPMKDLGYEGSYHYCYCTKSSHFSFVVNEAIKNGAHIETSSEFDINLVMNLHQKGAVKKDMYIICNGFKPKSYSEKIAALINEGFTQVIPVLDNKEELDAYIGKVNGPMNLGIRIAAEEEPNFLFYTSRLGIRYRDIVPFYIEKIQNQPEFKLKMLHFFINTGINDTTYYWSELSKSLEVYCALKKICPELNALNIGGGFPIRNSLGFEYDYAYMAREIVTIVKSACDEAGVPVPNIFTEFGKYTVGESGVILFTVLQEKWQNDSELWYMINSSIMTTLPDTWGISERFILLPLNKWNNGYHRVNIGGLSCDQYDYYNSEVHLGQVYLPMLDDKGPLYLGFFNVGAYQESLSGFGGTKHCLIPSPKHVLLDRNGNGKMKLDVFSESQSADSMMKVLGY